MAVRAADFAFVDFGFDARPGAAASGIDRDVGNLVTNVIELKNDDVRLAAVDAWMLSKVLNDLLVHFRASLSDLPQKSRLLTLMVLPIVPRVSLSEAVATPRLKLRLPAPHRGELIYGLELAAFRARSHEGERAVGSISRE